MKKNSIKILLLAGCSTLLFTGCQNGDVTDATTQSTSSQSSGIFDSITANPDIEVVKNGTIPELSDSLTVGNALDHWDSCTNPTWEAETTPRGEKLVKYTCEIVKDKIKINNCNQYDPIHIFNEETCQKNTQALEYLADKKIEIIFSLSTDGMTFTPKSVNSISTFNDGKKYYHETSELGYSLMEERWVSMVSSVLTLAFKNQPYSQDGFDVNQYNKRE